MNTFKLEGKSVIITGGLGGYGLAISELILKRGGRVLLADIKPQSEAETILQEKFKEAFEAKSILYTKCDVTSEADFEAAFKKAEKDLVEADGSVDILINNAGIVGEQNWQRIYEINIVRIISRYYYTYKLFFHFFVYFRKVCIKEYYKHSNT